MIQDIWNTICESQIIIGDLTPLNPNIMYELGISTAVDKYTIMIYQKNFSTFKSDIESMSDLKKHYYEIINHILLDDK